MTETIAPENRPFRILTVCTGNICRSPMAERLLQAGLDRRYPGEFVVESAGTKALEGCSIEPQMAEMITALGGNSEDFSARQLRPELLTDKDLVLALSREHRSQVVELAPAMLRRTFTLREFSRIIGRTPHQSASSGSAYLRSILPQIVRARSASTVSPDHDDVIDPYRRDTSIHQLASDQINSAINPVLHAV